MKTKFKSLCQLLIFLVMCGIMILIYTGCGSDGDDDDDSYTEVAESDASYGLFDASPPGLNPPNSAALTMCSSRIMGSIRSLIQRMTISQRLGWT